MQLERSIFNAQFNSRSVIVAMAAANMPSVLKLNGDRGAGYRGGVHWSNGVHLVMVFVAVQLDRRDASWKHIED